MRPMTVHAGEAAGMDSIREAIELDRTVTPCRARD